MKERIVTPSPEMELLAADSVTMMRGGPYGWRPEGTNDWLLILTLKGSGTYRFAGGDYQTQPGDLVLIPEGAPHDYETTAETGYWTNTWVHFKPRLDQRGFLDWPEIGPGVLVLELSRGRRKRAEKLLGEVVREVHALKPKSQQRAMNALERLLLDCDEINPRRDGREQDWRIRRAVEYIHDNFASSPSLAFLAKKVGLSRTRFTELFHRQVGEPPRRYVEKLRAMHARQLWEYGQLTLGEIAERLNYSSPYYLSLRFKQEFGASPRGLRKRKERR